MKRIGIILILIAITSSQSFGYYKFYKNFGGGFYDYGAGVYHGYSGSSLKPDPDDALCTDRGIYINGKNYFVTLQSDHWGTAPDISLPLEINIWAMVFNFPSTIIERKNGSQVLFRIKLRQDNELINRFFTSANNGNSYSYHDAISPFNSIEPQQWYFIRTVFSDGSSIQITSEINSVLVSTYSKDSPGTFIDDSEALTRIGKTNRPLNGFVYIANFFKSGSFDYTGYFTSSCSFSVSPCDYCPFGECLSESSDPFVNNEETLCSTFGCENGCNASGECLDCPYSSLPICDSSGSTSFENLCNSSCLGCVGPTAQDCLGCSSSLLTLTSSPGTCECLSNDPQDCLCAPDCHICSSTSQCEECLDPLAVPRSDLSGQCECRPGTYLDGSCKGKKYSECHQDCLECEEGNSCTSCKVEGAVPNEEGCDCPSGSAFIGNRCECNEGYFDIDDSASVECEECAQDCLSCEDRTSCLSCKNSELAPSSEGCSCPAGLHLESGRCACEKGYYKSEGKCFECEEGCEECDEKECYQCVLEYSFIDKDGRCSCPQNSSAEENECKCNEGYYGTEECKECRVECESCSDGESCLSCKDKNSSLAEGKCECPFGSELKEGYCVCIDGYEQSSKTFECSKQIDKWEEVLKPVSSTENIIVTTITVISTAISLVLSNPMNLLSLFNTLQILSYVPLHNIAFPAEMNYVTSSFDIRNFIPNIVIILMGPNKDYFRIDKANWRKYTETASFYENIGEYVSTMSMAIVCLVLLLICSLISQRCLEFTKRAIKEFKYNVFIRIFLDLYLVLMFSSIISFSLITEEARLETEHVIGSCFFIVGVLSPFVLGCFLYRIRCKIAQENYKTKYGTLFKSFEISESSESLMYYPICLFQRLTYIVSLFYLYNFPKLQVLVSTSGCYMKIWLLLTFIKLKGKMRHLLEVFSELTLLVFFLLSIFFLSDISDTCRQIIAFVMIGIIIASISLNLTYFFVRSIIEIARKNKDRKTSPTKVIPICLIEDERVFELSRNNVSNINGENNANIDLTKINS